MSAQECARRLAVPWPMRCSRPGVRPGKWQLDLYRLTTQLLHAAGVGEVSGERLCTFSDPRFYSYPA